MAYEAPTITEISQSVRSAYRSELPGTDPWIFPNNVYVNSKVIAIVLRAFYLRLKWVHLQSRVVTADTDALEKAGADIGITRDPSTQATGLVTVTATIGTSIPMGSRLLRSDNVAYLTITGVVTAGASTSLEVVSEEAGKTTNAEYGTALEFEVPISGAVSVVVGADGLRGGADVENDASLRERILFRKRNPPHGGSPAEYIEWSKMMPGVTRVFVRRATPEPGSVTILFMMDDTYSDGIPTAGDVTALTTILNALAPSNAKVNVKKPLPLPVDIEIVGLTPDNSTVRLAITDELKAMFIRRAEPGVAGSPFVFSRSWISEAISIATGEEKHVLSIPTGDITAVENSAGENEIAVLGSILFI